MIIVNWLIKIDSLFGRKHSSVRHNTKELDVLILYFEIYANYWVIWNKLHYFIKLFMWIFVVIVAGIRNCLMVFSLFVHFLDFEFPIVKSIIHFEFNGLQKDEAKTRVIVFRDDFYRHFHCNEISWSTWRTKTLIETKI